MSSSSSRSGARKRGSRAGLASRMLVGKTPVSGRVQPLFFKTKLCAFWQEGRCQRGGACKYAHGDAELMHEPDLSKTALCRKQQSGEECRDPNCNFAHTYEELRSTSNIFKTSMCAWFRAGACQMGKHCRYAHSDLELRRAIQGERETDSSTSPGKGSSYISDDEDSGDELGCDEMAEFGRSVTMPPALGEDRTEAAAKRRWSDLEDDEDDFDLNGGHDMWARMQTMPAIPESRSQDMLSGDTEEDLAAYNYQHSTPGHALQQHFKSEADLPWFRQFSCVSTASSLPDVPTDRCLQGQGSQMPCQGSQMPCQGSQMPCQDSQMPCQGSQMPYPAGSQGMFASGPGVALPGGQVGLPVGHVVVTTMVPVMMIPCPQAVTGPAPVVGDVGLQAGCLLRPAALSESTTFKEKMLRW